MQAVSNMLVIMDLNCVLKKPFDPPGPRESINFVIVILVISTFVTVSFLTSTEFLTFFFLTPTLTFSILISLLISVKILWRLCKHGTSKELRKIILRRHFVYIGLYCLLSVFITAYNFLIAVGVLNGNDEIAKEIAKWGRYLTLVASIGLLLARLSEPYVYINIKKEISRFLRCRNHSKAMIIEEKPL